MYILFWINLSTTIQKISATDKKEWYDVLLKSIVLLSHPVKHVVFLAFMKL